MLAPLLYFATLAVDLDALGRSLLDSGIVIGGWIQGYSRHFASDIGFSLQAVAFTLILVPIGIVLLRRLAPYRAWRRPWLGLVRQKYARHQSKRH